MAKKLTKEEIIKQRPDLIEAGRDALIDFIADGTLSLRHTSNFPVLLARVARNNSEDIDPILFDNLKKLIEQRKFDVSAYRDRNYLMVPEAHENAFPIYKKLHEKYKVPWNSLLAPGIDY